MNVWIVMYLYYEESELLGVFSTEQKAYNYVENGDHFHNKDHLSVFDVEVDYHSK